MPAGIYVMHCTICYHSYNFFLKKHPSPWVFFKKKIVRMVANRAMHHIYPRRSFIYSQLVRKHSDWLIHILILVLLQLMCLRHEVENILVKCYLIIITY